MLGRDRGAAEVAALIGDPGLIATLTCQPPETRESPGGPAVAPAAAPCQAAAAPTAILTSPSSVWSSGIGSR